MKLLIALIALLFMSCATTPLDSVVLIETDKGSGSGVLIFSEYGHSVILTAKHVIDDAKEVTVYVFPNKEKHAGVVIKVGIANDLALVRIDKKYPVTKVATPRVLAPFTKVVKVGAGTGRDPFPTEGIVASFDGDIITTTTPIWYGDSGGGLFSHGKLIGIVVRIAVDRRGFFAYPIPHIAISENSYAIWKFLEE